MARSDDLARYRENVQDENDGPAPGGRLSKGNRPVLRLVAISVTIVALLGACNSDQIPTDDRTGEIGQELGDLDRDVEDADEDPRQGPPDSP